MIALPRLCIAYNGVPDVTCLLHYAVGCTLNISSSESRDKVQLIEDVAVAIAHSSHEAPVPK